jgi:pyruvate dehydrogenase E2 component (dihydrolipoamide acetyltransferase)
MAKRPCAATSLPRARRFPTRPNEIIAIGAGGDTVLVEFWLTGTHLGPLRPKGRTIAPAGQTFRVRMAATFDFSAGSNKIACERPYSTRARSFRPWGARERGAMSTITAVRMPKWGLSMQEGKVLHWWKRPGETLVEGEDLVDIETSKITNTFEAPLGGVLRRIVAEVDETLPVGALIAIVADEAAPEGELDRFVEDFQASFTPEAEDAGGEDALTLGTVEAGGRTLRFGRTAGEGTPIVLLHGFGADLNSWLFNLDALSSAAPVIAFDLPGHGASSKDVGDGSLATFAGAVAGALAALGVQRAHLVGHSLGAAVAARLALDRSDLCASLTLIAPAGLPGSTVSEDFLTGFVEAGRARDLRPVLERLVSDPALISRDMVDDVLKSKRLDGAQEALAILRERMIDGVDFRDLAARLSELPAAMVIAGRVDAIVGEPDAAALPASWKIAWIECAGHMPHLEKAGEVNALILTAIAEARG